MAYEKAKQYVIDHEDDDNIGDDIMVEVFTTLYGRRPDYQDKGGGPLVSLLFGSITPFVTYSII